MHFTKMLPQPKSGTQTEKIIGSVKAVENQPTVESHEGDSVLPHSRFRLGVG